MDERTLKALKDSIEHHRNNLSKEKPSLVFLGSGSCALCREFASRVDENNRCCSGCPVRERTGKDGCLDTPWFKLSETRSHWKSAENSSACELYRDAFRAAEHEEIAFLESLLPDSETLETEEK